VASVDPEVGADFAEEEEEDVDEEEEEGVGEGEAVDVATVGDMDHAEVVYSEAVTDVED